MTRPHIPVALRRLVLTRAEQRCEYCLLPAAWVSIAHHVDHIIPLKHGGATVADNLACACFECNIGKGSDIAAFDPLTGQLVRLFNPRTVPWSVHFTLTNGDLLGLNPVARATAQLLQFNTEARVHQRRLLITADLYRF